jgi:predicted nucleic-acid-binding protein
LTAHDPAWIGLVVTAELVWALRAHYGYNRGQIAEAIGRLLESAEVQFEREHLVEEALLLYGGGRVDLADALIVLVNRENGCQATASFDRRLVAYGLAIEP